jgi:hypothetical protein
MKKFTDPVITKDIILELIRPFTATSSRIGGRNTSWQVA